MQAPPSESEPFQRVTGPPSVPGNAQGLLGKFSRLWFSMQVSHRGRYSIERLLALEEYNQRTPWYRVAFVCVGTPLPMIAFVLSQECIPLQPPTDGWKANYGLWIRAAILSGVVGGTVLIQVKFLIQRVQLSIRQMILVLVGVMSGYTAIALAVAATVVFPIPFLSISMIVPFFTLIVVSLWVIVGKQFFLNVFAHLDQLLGFMLFISAQTLMAVIYPAYQVLFDAATNTVYELPVILLLAFIKFITRNLVSVSISHMEDMIPEAVIFTVDFFNAVYVVTCMQQTSSFVTAATIILIDLVHTVIAIRSLKQNSSIILDQLHREFGGHRSERLHLLAVSSSLCHNRVKFETQKLSSVELRSCLPHALSPAGGNLLSNLEKYSHKRPSLSIPWRSRRNAASAQDVMNASFRKTSQRDSQRGSFRSASVHAMNAISVKPASTTVVPMAKDTQRATHSSWILQKSLGILFTSECLVLTEYLESVIPIFYASYVRVMVQLPSAPYHTELEGLTRENVASTVQTVAVYGVMECLSFLVLVVVIHRNCGMRALYHLAFVLETQMPLIQSKLMTWMLLTLACRVLHFANRQSSLAKPDTHAVQAPVHPIQATTLPSANVELMRTSVTPLVPIEAGPRTTSDFHATHGTRAMLRLWFTKLKRAWLATQVSHRGKYSIERLLALEEYTRSTSLLRVLLVCVGTPLPIIILVISQEALPLEDPSEGWRANWGFWIRAAILGGMVSNGITGQFNYLMEGINMSLKQSVLQWIFMAIGYTAASILVASTLVFPIPFMIIAMTTPFMVLLGASWRIILGKSSFDRIITSRHELQRFIRAVSVQVLMALAYPAYQVLFKTIAGSAYELPAFLLLPVIKMVLKNLVAFSLADLADVIPENIVFTVNFFNAIYLATCMQSASSTFAVATIMAIDFVETGFALNGIYRSSTRIMKQLRRTISSSMADTLVTSSYLLCHCHEKFSKEERAQIETRSCLQHHLSPAGRDILTKLDQPTFNVDRSSNTHSMPTIKSVDSAKTKASRFRALFSQQWGAMVQPIAPVKAIHVKLARGERSRDIIQVVEAVPSVQHIACLRSALTTLFTIECVVLTEYIESVIPLMYGNYVLMMVRLPSSRYHTELTGLTEENAGPTVQTVFVYGLLELASFVLLVVLMKRSCGVQALYHLAFVLENQCLSIQSQTMGWMLITLGFRVVHFGVDFTFQFSWIRDRYTSG